MRKFLFMLYIAFTVIATASAQEASQHMTFKGIPIDGTLNSFVTQLKQKGFTHISTDDGVAMLSGDFASYKDCGIVVLSSKEKDLVIKVLVIFPSRDTWSALENNYLSLKNMLTTKYGEPTDCVETFQSYSQPRDDNARMNELQIDRCKYQTLFVTDKGNIELKIDHHGYSECYVQLVYCDALNQKIIMSDAMDDL